MSIKFFVILMFFCSCAFSNVVEKRIKIGVIDSGISTLSSKYLCHGEYKLSRVDENKSVIHGDNVISLIMKGIDLTKFCVHFHDNKDKNGLSKAIYNMAKNDVTIINMSLSGPVFDEFELRAIKLAIKSGIVVNVAAGNEGAKMTVNNCDYFPACNYYYLTPHERKSFNVIANASLTSNYGEMIRKTIDGNKVGYRNLSGSSQSVAMFTNSYITGTKK